MTSGVHALDGTRRDLIGVGLGPSNLSLAALAEPVAGLRTLFLERRPRFEWHPGLMVDGAHLQVSFLKDLVSLVDPTNPYSFLNFLASEGRLYRFLIRGDEPVTRQEYAQYYSWASERLTSARFGAPVESIKHGRSQGFIVTGRGWSATTPNLVLGCGRVPRLPRCAEGLVSPRVVHAAALLEKAPETRDAEVLVVGGGQSGAEVVAHLLDTNDALPRRLTWVSRRHNFLPLDDTPFVNEWFIPPYVSYFHGLEERRRRELVDQQKLASDGISVRLLEHIYRRLYQLDLVDGGPFEHRLLAGHELIALLAHPDAVVATLRNRDRDELHRVDADVVILATGYESEPPACLVALRERIGWSGYGCELRRDYSLKWDGPPEHRIFVQNAGLVSHGIADPNLSLAAWRSATILNSIVGRDVYPTSHVSSTLAWDEPVYAGLRERAEAAQ